MKIYCVYKLAGDILKTKQKKTEKELHDIVTILSTTVKYNKPFRGEILMVRCVLHFTLPHRVSF